MTDRFLAPREMEVLVMLTVGKTNREIASAMGISQGTVKYYLSSIYRKLDVSNRTEAAVVGLRIGKTIEDSNGRRIDDRT
jgi:DNA-binding NarL/FixJ family response regulator